MNKGSEEVKGTEAGMQQGDWFVAVSLVDLAVTLFTLGVKFYNPVKPYNYQQLGGKRMIRFLFKMESSIEGVESTTSLMKKWTKAESETHPLSLVSVCKRTIWERRWLLREVNKNSFPVLQGLAKNEIVAPTIHTAAIAYALGFKKPAKCVVEEHGNRVMLVGTEVPEWLKPLCPTFQDFEAILAEGLPYIEREGNEINPIAVAMATFMNIVAWLEHLRSDKPFMLFETPTGKSYWVKEGTDKWKELLELGYSPE